MVACTLFSPILARVSLVCLFQNPISTIIDVEHNYINANNFINQHKIEEDHIFKTTLSGSCVINLQQNNPGCMYFVLLLY